MKLEIKSVWWVWRALEEFDAGVEEADGGRGAAVVGDDFGGDEGGEHLALEEARQEGHVPRRLVRQERRLIERVHQLAVRQPRLQLLAVHHPHSFICESDRGDGCNENYAKLAKTVSKLAFNMSK